MNRLNNNFVFLKQINIMHVPPLTGAPPSNLGGSQIMEAQSSPTPVHLIFSGGSGTSDKKIAVYLNTTEKTGQTGICKKNIPFLLPTMRGNQLMLSCKTFTYPQSSETAQPCPLRQGWRQWWSSCPHRLSPPPLWQSSWGLSWTPPLHVLQCLWLANTRY